MVFRSHKILLWERQRKLKASCSLGRSSNKASQEILYPGWWSNWKCLEMQVVHRLLKLKKLRFLVFLFQRKHATSFHPTNPIPRKSLYFLNWSMFSINTRILCATIFRTQMQFVLVVATLCFHEEKEQRKEKFFHAHHLGIKTKNPSQTCFSFLLHRSWTQTKTHSSPVSTILFQGPFTKHCKS